MGLNETGGLFMSAGVNAGRLEGLWDALAGPTFGPPGIGYDR
jgi:hypothetical protein